MKFKRSKQGGFWRWLRLGAGRTWTGDSKDEQALALQRRELRQAAIRRQEFAALRQLCRECFDGHAMARFSAEASSPAARRQAASLAQQAIPTLSMDSVVR